MPTLVFVENCLFIKAAIVFIVTSYHLFSLGDGMDGLGEVINVCRVDPGEADASVLGEVDVKVVGEALDLARVETGVAEHAALVGDVRPGVFRTEGVQFLAHGNDPGGHALYLFMPTFNKHTSQLA